MMIAMIDAADGHPVPEERVKAAAVQLLPALFDGLHAHRLAGYFREGRSMEQTRAQHQLFYTIVVSTACYANALAHFSGAHGRCGMMQTPFHPFGCLTAHMLVGCWNTPAAYYAHSGPMCAPVEPWAPRSLKLGSAHVFASWSAMRGTARLCSAADGRTTLQAVCNRLATYGLGSIVEACDTAVPFFAGALRDMADQGAPALRCTAACCI